MGKIRKIKRSIEELAQRTAKDCKRTLAITRLRMELAALDRRRKELFARLGERVNELRMKAQILDVGLLGLLQPEFDDIDRLDKEIQDTLEMIQEVSLEGFESASETEGAEKPRDSSAVSLLDSFEVI